jgi:hypothetical protein
MSIHLALTGIQSSQFDPDALAFISAATITDIQERYAINNLVTGLKLNGLWTKMQAIYPFVGPSSTTHKWNLKDPRDLDAAFRLTFLGGWTHTSSGALPNGTNGYANTFFTPSNSSNVNSTHLSIYLNTDNASIVTPGPDPVEIGVFVSPTQAFLIQQGVAATFGTRNLGSTLTGAQTNRLGFGLSSRTSATVTTGYKNGVSILSGNSGGSLSPFEVWIGNLNISGGSYGNGWTNNRFGFASIGSGLNATEAANFYTVVQAYQTALSRQV